VPETPIQEMVRALSAVDLEGALALFAPDGSLTNAFGETASGSDEVRLLLGTFLHGLRAANYEVTAEWNPESGVWIAEMSASYELTDYSRRGPYGRAMILRLSENGIELMRVYGDRELPLAEEGRPYENVRGPHGWLPTL
jgi:SnoaL-like domain